MITSKRDLLVLSKKASHDPKQLQDEVDLLDLILFQIETTANLCSCTEVIDVNRYKIIRKPVLVERVIRQKQLKPFQFLYNKN